MTKNAITRIFSRIPTLETSRLIMRKIAVSDYKDMYEYSRDERVSRYLLWSPHPSDEYTYDYITALQSAYKKGDFYDWALITKDSNKMIGTCGITSFDLENKRAEIGYVLSPFFWGKGYASEAISAVLEFIFTELDINRVEAHIIEGNEKSVKTAISCGMKVEGVLQDYMLIKGKFQNIVFCSVTRDKFLRKGLYVKRAQRTVFDKLGDACRAISNFDGREKQ